MNKSLIIFALLIGVSSAVDAQQVSPDPAFLAKAVVSLQGQRNQALDQEAATEARLAQANDKIKELEDKIKELQKKPGEESQDKKK
jgi:TolA-binding protein